MLRFKFTAYGMPNGLLGWRDSRIAKDSPYGTLAEAYGLAHDCLDHFALTSLSDEIEAHGAMYYGRYCPEYKEMGFDILAVANLRGLGYQWNNLAKALEEYNLHRAPTLHETSQPIIDDIIKEGFKQLKYWGHANWTHKAETISKEFRGWFMSGYLKAKARWETWGYEREDIIDLFTRLIKVFKSNMPLSPGDTMEVMIHQSDGFTVLRNPGDLNQRWETYT